MSSTMSPATLVDFLLQPTAYPESTDTVDLVETHISWVFLTDRYAYKLKKPVAFDFLDFSTLEDRRQACEEELRLNRRLTSNVYIDVVPVRENARGNLSFHGAGRAVDYLVKMRRLAEDQTLERLILDGRCQSDTVAVLANRLADFYTSAASMTVKPQDYRGAIDRHVRANFEELSNPACELPLDVLQRIHGAQLQFLRSSFHLLDERVCDRRIVEGHGDLRPEHIFVERIPQIIDCIEFDRDLRTIDVADELCFLAMECDRIGGRQIGCDILSEYQSQSHDRPDERLLAFYKCYRAMVRAKVAVLRAQQIHDAQRHDLYDLASEYLTLAQGYVHEFARPFVVVVRGLMGTGKSTLARALAESLGAELIQTDVVRRELFGASQEPEPYGTGTYGAEHRQQVYAELLHRGDNALAGGRAIVFDGTFPTRDLRNRVVETATRDGASSFFVECYCPEEVAQERIRDRLETSMSESEARPDMYQAQVREQEPDTHELPGMRIDTTGAVNGQLEHVLKSLASEIQSP